MSADYFSVLQQVLIRCDFFLLGVMKDRVYKPMPVNMVQLKEKITTVFNDISKETVKKAVFNMKAKAGNLVAVEGMGLDELS